MEDRIPINDKECEDVMIGTLISDRNAFNTVRDILTEDCFYDYFNKTLFKAISAIVEKGNTPDIITVKAELDAHGEQYDFNKFLQLADKYTIDTAQYAARLKDLSSRRKLRTIGLYLLQNSGNEEHELEEVSQKAADDISSIFSSDVSDVMTIRDGIKNVNTIIKRNLSPDKELTGTPTGFHELDRKSGGLQGSDLIIIAAESSQGKSSMAMSVSLNAAKAGSKIAIYSMEMRAEQLTARIMAMESGVPSSNILYSRLDGGQLNEIEKGIGRIEGLDIFFDDRSTSSIDTILSSIRYMKMKYHIDGAVVDYLQILNVNMKNSNKEQQMGDVSRRLKNIAKELNIWVIALSQLNRNREDPTPTLARLRDSGQIAEAADTVMLIYRPEFYGKTSYSSEFSNVSVTGTAMIDIAKGRNIGTMKFICGFNAPTTHFYDLDNIPANNSPLYEEDNPF